MKFLVLLTAILFLPQRSYSETVHGQIISIERRINLVWIRGEHCRSTRMCEGAIYGGVRVAVSKEHNIHLERLVLLQPETTDCRNGDAYWAISVINEVFAPSKSGTIRGHPYSDIRVSPLQATLIDLTAATDKKMGFAANGLAYIGIIEMTVMFNNPFPEDLYVKSFCQEGIAGTAPIRKKTLNFGPLSQSFVQTP